MAPIYTYVVTNHEFPVAVFLKRKDAREFVNSAIALFSLDSKFLRIQRARTTICE